MIEHRHQDDRPTCAGGIGRRRLASVVRFILVGLLPVVLALAVLVAMPAEGSEHPFGEAGTERRTQVQETVNGQLRLAYHYAFHWARANQLKCPTRIPAVVFCRDAEDLAARTGCSLSDRGGRVVGRADITTNTIYLAKISSHALYHECYHAMFCSWDERNAEAFAAWCVKMDEQLEELKRTEGRGPATQTTLRRGKSEENK